MAITKTKQNWTTGQTVKVGFLSLQVVQCIPTPGDYAPDAYLLVNAAQTTLYKFVPHNGLEKINREEANQLIAHSVQVARDRANQAIQKAMQ
jgi:catalase